jgi:hypothetical protein
MMRTWVYNRVKAIITTMDVFSSGNADDPPTRPFAVITMDVEVPFFGMPPEAKVQEIPFAVWLHDEPGSMLKIDDAAIALKNSLPTRDGAVIGGLSLFEIRWTSTGADAHDDFYKTSSRPVRFTAVAKR